MLLVIIYTCLFGFSSATVIPEFSVSLNVSGSLQIFQSEGAQSLTIGAASVKNSEFFEKEHFSVTLLGDTFIVSMIADSKLRMFQSLRYDAGSCDRADDQADGIPINEIAAGGSCFIRRYFSSEIDLGIQEDPDWAEYSRVATVSIQFTTALSSSYPETGITAEHRAFTKAFAAKISRSRRERPYSGIFFRVTPDIPWFRAYVSDHRSANLGGFRYQLGSSDSEGRLYFGRSDIPEDWKNMDLFPGLDMSYYSAYLATLANVSVAVSVRTRTQYVTLLTDNAKGKIRAFNRGALINGDFVKSGDETMGKDLVVRWYPEQSSIWLCALEFEWQRDVYGIPKVHRPVWSRVLLLYAILLISLFGAFALYRLITRKRNVTTAKPVQLEDLTVSDVQVTDCDNVIEKL